MPPDIRQQVGSRSLLPLEVAPQLKYILRPVIKMQNMHLMSALDKARLEAHAGIMALMGLRYHTSHESGAQDLVLDPAIDKLVTFESGASDEASPMSQELIKYLDFQVCRPSQAILNRSLPSLHPLGACQLNSCISTISSGAFGRRPPFLLLHVARIPPTFSSSSFPAEKS